MLARDVQPRARPAQRSLLPEPGHLGELLTLLLAHDGASLIGLAAMMPTTHDDIRGTEGPFTHDELGEIRERLVQATDRLRVELRLARDDLASATAESAGCSAHEVVDVASNHVAAFQGAGQADNAAAILEQTERVLERLDAGLYGTCEWCAAPIGRPRLRAFPRATLCLDCLR